jgi:hypothetical protein
LRFVIVVTKPHGRGIVAIVVDTSHNTLIITEEEDREPSYAVDSYEKRPLLVLASDVPFPNVLHVVDGRRMRRSYELIRVFLQELQGNRDHEAQRGRWKLYVQRGKLRVGYKLT